MFATSYLYNQNCVFFLLLVWTGSSLSSVFGRAKRPCSFLHHPTVSPIRLSCRARPASTWLGKKQVDSATYAAKSSSQESSADNIHRPKNEFSRTYRTEAVLGNRRRDYGVSISANTYELEALAKRFQIAKISKLEAEVVLRNDSPSGGTQGQGVQASGSISAIVTQTCVRTNENFEEGLDFDFFSAIRPASTRDNLSGLEDVGAATAVGRKGKSRRDAKVRGGKQLDDTGMKELQELMQDFSIEDDVIEDEAILKNGVLDVGELVAQRFCLKLDPYPKKPGSEPINISFTM